MRRLRIVAHLVALFVCASPLSAQTYGVWDVACELSLSPRFSYPHLHGVIYEGQEFLTGWRSIDQTPPLPSYNWYEPIGQADVPSVDNDYVWYDAKIFAHCFVERNAYYTQNHVHPIKYAGRVRAFCTTPPRSSSVEQEPYSAGYDPYQAEGSYSPESECGDGTGGSGDGNGGGDIGDGDGLQVTPESGSGGDGRSMCPDNAPYYWDIDCIDIYVEGEGWVEYWCGAVMVCG
jgi:hypothetical protein